MSEPGAQYHDAISANATRSVTFTGRGCNGAVTVRESAMMDAAPVSLGVGARMRFLYRDPANHSDPNENSVVVRLDLGSRPTLPHGDADGVESKQPSEPHEPGDVEAKPLTRKRGE